MTSSSRLLALLLLLLVRVLLLLVRVLLLLVRVLLLLLLLCKQRVQTQWMWMSLSSSNSSRAQQLSQQIVLGRLSSGSPYTLTALQQQQQQQQRFSPNRRSPAAEHQVANLMPPLAPNPTTAAKARTLGRAVITCSSNSSSSSG
jgi:hypothetical protein